LARVGSPSLWTWTNSSTGRRSQDQTGIDAAYGIDSHNRSDRGPQVTSSGDQAAGLAAADQMRGGRTGKAAAKAWPPAIMPFDDEDAAAGAGEQGGRRRPPIPEPTTITS
jgi:hypothetical protein